MYRNVFEELNEWKHSSRRKPLIVRGVRQCGKTYALMEFGRENYPSTAYFNFEDTPDLGAVFEYDLDPRRIIKELSARYHVHIDEDTLIIFDEIQYCNAALTSLKYFCENAPEYHVVCAGSLLGVMLSKPLSFPVGKVDMITLRPMSFPEFLMAVGESELLKMMEQQKIDVPVNEAFMNILERRYREYCFTGGMPEAVETWSLTSDPDKVRKVQKNILTAYSSDFSKHAPPKDMQRLNRIWDSIPMQLSRENKKFLFGHAVEGARARDLEDALQWLIDAGLVIKVNMIERPFMPLSSYAVHSAFKLYLCDVGLLGAMAGVPAASLLYDDKYTEFKGGMTENYVLSELLSRTDRIPFYWRSGSKAEVDFVHMISDEIVPIEVKSGRPRRFQSLELYVEQYDPKRAFVISEGNIKTGKVTMLPLPLVWKIEQYV